MHASVAKSRDIPGKGKIADCVQVKVNNRILFGALNSIVCTALLEEAPQTESLVYALSDYLRYALKNVNDLPRLMTEVDDALRCLSMQKARLGEKLRFDADIAPEVMACRVPPMLLRPIVENSVVHGLEAKKNGGCVWITAKLLGGSLVNISVRDNGIGFSKKALKDFNAGIDSGGGLSGVRGRIRGLFGDDYGVSAECDGCFTDVSIRLPRDIPARADNV
jgi:LytS/YehU family sensor histidine kinase